jgi:hypothetical protein
VQLACGDHGAHPAIRGSLFREFLHMRRIGRVAVVLMLAGCAGQPSPSQIIASDGSTKSVKYCERYSVTGSNIKRCDKYRLTTISAEDFERMARDIRIKNSASGKTP